MPTYDADGNILKLRDWTLQWDAENRLVSASNDTEVIRYGHDYMGRRVWREAAGVTNRFDYDGWALIRDYREDGGLVVTNCYFYGPDLSGTLQGAGTIGGLWARIGEGGVLGFSYDGNGNVTDLVDLTGAVRGHYEYAPFGGLTTMAGDLAASNPFRFSTKRQDESTGLLGYGYRDLDTVWGRWASRDPIGEKGGINLYGALLNSPVNYVDAYGNRITVTFANEGNETQAVIVHATIQIVDCLTPPSGAEKDAFKRKIEAVWAALAYYRESVPARVSSNVIRNESITRKRKIRTTVDIKYITSDSKKDPTRHTFYFLGKQGTDIDRSHAEIGGNESWIYKEDHNQPRTIAHEFGHWLGLGEMYGDLIVDGRAKSVGEPDNIMGLGEDVWASQMLEIWHQYQAGKLNQGIKGK